MVAVVGAPAEGQFGQVPCAYHDAAFLAGHIHQNLGAFAGLGIFVGGVGFVERMLYILEVLGSSRHDGDFLTGDAEFFHEDVGVALGAAAGAEARHGDADDAAALPAQTVERTCGDQQGQSGIKTA